MMIYKSLGIALILLAAALSSEGMQMQKVLIGCGGGRSQSSTYKIDCSIGQACAGFATGGGYFHWIGFWFKESAAIVDAATAAEAKTKPDGTLVSLSGKIVSAGKAELGDRFYIQEADRSSGIQVYCGGASVPNVIEGQIVNVAGVMGTRSGERCITSPAVIVISSGNAPDPLSITSSSLGGGYFGQGSAQNGQQGVTGGIGLNNVGLLVLTWGRVEAEGQGYVMINDGESSAGNGVKVDVTLLAEPPEPGDYVKIVGISSLELNGQNSLVPVLRPRKQSDLQIISE